MRTREVEPQAEKRMIAYAETNPQAQVRYHTVADGHRDEAALVVLGSLLSGRTGRLYKSLVLDQKVATAASAGQNGLKWEGYFMLNATARPGTTPGAGGAGPLQGDREAAGRRRSTARELQKVKNRFAADNFRRLESNFAADAAAAAGRQRPRAGSTFNEDPKQIEAVTAEDVQRVAKTYFKPERRAVILYYTKNAEGGAAETDPMLAGPQRSRRRRRSGRCDRWSQQMPVEKAKQMLAASSSRPRGSAPPEKTKVLKVHQEASCSRRSRREPSDATHHPRVAWPARWRSPSCRRGDTRAGRRGAARAPLAQAAATAPAPALAQIPAHPRDLKYPHARPSTPPDAAKYRRVLNERGRRILRRRPRPAARQRDGDGPRRAATWTRRARRAWPRPPAARCAPVARASTTPNSSTRRPTSSRPTSRRPHRGDVRCTLSVNFLAKDADKALDLFFDMLRVAGVPARPSRSVQDPGAAGPGAAQRQHRPASRRASGRG